MLAEVLGGLEAIGHRVSAVQIGRLEELRAHYEDLLRQGVLDERIGGELLDGLTLRAPEAASPTTAGTMSPTCGASGASSGSRPCVPICRATTGSGRLLR